MAPDGTSLDARIYSHIPMSGDGSGMGAPAPALAGYSGKVQEQLASLNNCPWCAAKGLACALRSYRLNLRESITLCPSPQCLYPLVPRPLEDVLASLVPPDPQTGTKRKISCGEEEDPVPSSKRPRAEEEEEEETRLQSGDVTHTGKTQSTDTESTDTIDYHRDSDWPVQEETDREVAQGEEATAVSKMAAAVDLLFSPQEAETEVIEGYRKDSDWPVQEETDQEVAHGEEATAVSKMAAAVDLLFSPREAVPSSEEAEGKEMALCAPVEAVPSIAATVPSQTEDGSLVLHTTVASSDEAASAADEAASTVEEAAPTVKEAASTIDEAISAVVEAASIADEAACTVDKTASTVDEAISAVVEAASIADKAASIADEAVSTIDEAISAVVEAASIADEAVSPQAEAVVVSSECEEDVLSTGDEVQTELSLQAMDTPCSTDLRSPGIPNKEEEPPSTTITTPAPDREELAEMEEKRCTGEDELNALGNGEQASQALQNWLKGGAKRLKVKPVLNQGPVCSNELVPAPSQLFWRNEHKLCWLDTLMVAMVNCRALRERRPKSRPRHATLWELCETYDQACALLRCYQQHYQDGVVRVPSSLLQMVTERMNMYRMCIVNLLQPKLRFKLGDEETPVFAMPLLLKLDTWAEPQFQLVYRWEFLCCHRKSKNSFVKTLSTFTEVVSDWHPLNAVHQARCGTCRKQVTRMMQLESVPPVFALHFEKGLPCTDVSNYSFSFHDNHYSVTMVIQYLLQKHFVTWIRKPDGSWLEFDDLKHPECLTHNKLTIPAHEMHVVFWERENNGSNLLTCSSSDGFTETGSVVRELDRSLEAKDFFADDEPVSLEAEDLLADEPVSLEAEDSLADESVSLEAEDFLADESVSLESKDFLADESVSLEAKDFLADEPVDPLDRSHDLSLLVPQDDTAIVEALTVSSDEEVAMDTNVAADIGSATLLDAFEGLSHSDIVTLTLVEVKVDPEKKPSDSDGPVPESGPSSSCEAPPDSSAPDTPPPAPEMSLESSPEMATSKVRRGIIQPSVMSTPAEVSPVEITTPVSSIPSVKPLAKPLSRKKRWPAPLWVTVDPEENPLDSDDPVPENDVLAHSPAPDTPLHAPATSHESSPEMATSEVHRGIIKPSVMHTPSEVSPLEITTPVSSIPSVKPLAQRRSRKKKGPAPPLVVRVDPEENQLDIGDPVPENRLSSSCEVLAHSPAPDTPPHAPEMSHEPSPEMATSKVCRGIILPSVMSTPSEEITTPVSSIPSIKPLAQPLSRTTAEPAPINIEKSGWTHLLNNHPAIFSNSTPAPSTQRKPQLPNQSNAIPLRRPQLLKGVRSLRKEDNEALPAKAAEMYGGFPARGTNHPTEPKTAAVPHTQSATHKSNRGAAQNGTPKVPLQPRAPFPRNPSINNAAAVSVTRPPPLGVTTELPKTSSAKKHGGSHKSKVPPGLDDIAALRYKLLKKLKAKKKRLDELNQRLGFQGEAARGQPPAPKPDSTALDSPYDVSSTTSVYNSPVYDEFFAELLSPTTTASSNLSPDSTGLLLANGQEGGGDTAYAGSPIGGACQENAVTLQLGKPVETPAVDGFMTTTDDNFMDEFISGADMQQQTEMETEELNVLEMFF